MIIAITMGLPMVMATKKPPAAASGSEKHHVALLHFKLHHQGNALIPLTSGPDDR